MKRYPELKNILKPIERSWSEVFSFIFRGTGVLPYWTDVDVDVDAVS